MQVHLINLDRSPERLAIMSKALAERHVPFARLPAIDGRAIGAAVLALHPNLSRGEIGCLLSHRAAWKLIAEANDPFGAVLEDDLLLAPSLSLFTAGAGWIPHDANLVKLETTLLRVLTDRMAASVHAGRRIVSLRSPHLASAGYIISRPTAAALLAQETANLPVDVLLFGGTALKIYQVVPALCIQIGENSLIRDERRRHRRQRESLLVRHAQKAMRYLRRRFTQGGPRAPRGGETVELGAVPFEPD